MRIFKKLAGVVFLAGLVLLALSAESIEFPQMPSMPEAPEITFPVMGGSYYRPSFPNGAVTPKTPSAPAQPSQTALSTETVLSDGTTTDDIVSGLISKNTGLSAQDISTLYDMGLFGSISSLSGATTLAGYNQTSSDAVLTQILKILEEMKSAQAGATSAEKETLAATQSDSETFRQRSPSILRFMVNGYNIADSLVTVFFSDTENDGSFLLTADRKYFADQRARTETFYMLFKAQKSNGASVTYEVVPSITQDYKNENSFVYRLCQQKNLTAEKTGNLVVLNSVADNFSADILLDIDSKR